MSIKSSAVCPCGFRFEWPGMPSRRPPCPSCGRKHKSGDAADERIRNQYSTAATPLLPGMGGGGGERAGEGTGNE